jgi:hypothetical protein
VKIEGGRQERATGIKSFDLARIVGLMDLIVVGTCSGSRCFNECQTRAVFDKGAVTVQRKKIERRTIESGFQKLEKPPAPRAGR